MTGSSEVIGELLDKIENRLIGSSMIYTPELLKFLTDIRRGFENGRFMKHSMDFEYFLNNLLDKIEKRNVSGEDIEKVKEAIKNDMQLSPQYALQDAIQDSQGFSFAHVKMVERLSIDLKPENFNPANLNSVECLRKIRNIYSDIRKKSSYKSQLFEQELCDALYRCVVYDLSKGTDEKDIINLISSMDLDSDLGVFLKYKMGDIVEGPMEESESEDLARIVMCFTNAEPIDVYNIDLWRKVARCDKSVEHIINEAQSIVPTNPTKKRETKRTFWKRRKSN